jgi:hypothetical protein
MRTLFAAAVLFLFVPTTLGQTGDTGIFRVTERVLFKGSNQQHTANLVITTRAFNPVRHRIDWRTRDTKSDGSSRPGPSVTAIDGRRPLGTNGELPRTEIESITVFFDGVKLLVPKQVFSDFYNPNFSKDSWGTKLSDNGEGLLIFMAGGKGTSLYQVIWILKKNRQHVRFFNNCSECDYKSILNFLKEK